MLTLGCSAVASARALKLLLTLRVAAVIVLPLTAALKMPSASASTLTAPMFTSVVLIFLGTTLTGIGVYDQIGRYAGAGSIVPITGFANSVAAPAIEYRREGMVMGVGARIFQLAGPVLTYGITSSMLVGILYWIARMWFL